MDTEKLLESLEAVSKQHEESVVIELGTDRLIRWFGVYVILFLAIVFKIGELATSGIACYPVGETTTNIQFITFASTYCWENNDNIPDPSTNSSWCSTSGRNVTLSRDPTQLKRFIAYFPYVMLAQALVFALPFAYWHFRVGAPLMGHLRFMQLLLNEIFESVGKVRGGRPRDKAYDVTCETLDGNRIWEPDQDSIKTKNESETAGPPTTARGSSSDVEANSETSKERKPMLTEDTLPTDSDLSHKVKSKRNEKSKRFYWKCPRFSFGNLIGEMRDRHLFSIFCYENFANLHHLPYILSVFSLNEFNDKPKLVMPIKKALLEIWCHKDNLTNTFLVKRYVGKHLVTACLAFCMTALLITWFLACGLGHEIMKSNTFGCEIPYHHFCLLCSIKRLPDVIVLYAIDLFVIMIVFVMSMFKLCDIRRSRKLYKSHFFENLKKTNNLSFEMAEE